MTKRSLLFAAQAAITLLLLVLLFRGFDWRSFDALFARLPMTFYAASLLIVLTGQLLYAWRWHVLLTAAGVRVSFGRALEQFFLGLFVNNFIPSNVGGDVARGYRLGREHGFHAVAASIVLDRILGVGLLAIVAALAMWVAPSAEPIYRTVRVSMAVIAIGAAGGLGVLLAGTGGLARRMSRLGPRAVGLAEHLRLFRLECAPARNPVVLAKALLAVIGYFVLLTIAYQWFLQLQLGRPGAFVPVLAVVASASVLSNVPVSINGLGLREQLHVVLLHSLGVPKEPAVAISLLLFTHMWLLSLAGGVFWMRAARSFLPRPAAACSNAPIPDERHAREL